MNSRKTQLALAAISVLPLSHAAALSPATPTAGSPLAVDEYSPAAPPPTLDIIDNNQQSEVLLNGHALTPYIYDDQLQLGPDGAPLYPLTHFSPGGFIPVLPGDIYFTTPTTNAAFQTLAAMIRFYPDGNAGAGVTSALFFSVFSFSALNGTPDGSPFTTTVYPAGVSASGGLPGMPTVSLNDTYIAPSGTDDPTDVGTYTFTLVPEPASATLLGIGATILLRRRRTH